ncbi:MAG TPA: lyase family protein, partial [Acidimicrobiales bacterium]|nr:lyase family protein [Acidimicrobiales bacterium]
MARIERDTLGEVAIADGAWWGPQTQRAIANFPISGDPLPPELLEALIHVKRAAAAVNARRRIISKDVAAAIEAVGAELVAEARFEQFPLDVFQTGSGTSTNMNANEVVSNRAIELLGGQIGSRKPVHPNDHVNVCQSSNDVIPTAIHIAALTAIEEELIPALRRLQTSLERR